MATEIGGGIALDSDCMIDGTCAMYPNKTIQVRGGMTEQENGLGMMVQDVFLGATFFIGTIATIALIISGMMMIFGGASESQFEKGKTGMKYSIIGILLVIFSYSIIRLVEYIAQGKT